MFNLNYVNSFFTFAKHALWINLLVLTLSIVASVLHYKKNKDFKIFLLLFLVLIVSGLTINIGYSFIYYFLLFAPIFILTTIVILAHIQNEKIILLCLIGFSILFLSLLTRKGYYFIKEGKHYKEEIVENEKTFQTLIEDIPEAERDRLYYYNIYPTIYLYDGITANYKYCFIQEWHGMHDGKIFDEINTMMENNAPLYVMIPQYEGDTIDENKYYNKEFYKILKNRYTVFNEDEHRVILKIADNSSSPH